MSELTIDQMFALPEVQENILTDGKLICRYADIYEFFNCIAYLLDAKGVHPHECLSLECNNNVATALLLLFLLKTGRSFLLLPHRVEKGGGKPVIPSFCRCHIMFQPMQAENLEQLGSAPDQYMSFKINPQYRKNAGGLQSQKVYLRTSGSTGSSKIVVHSHRTLLQNAMNCVDRYDLAAEDRVFIPVPIFHMYGFGAALLPAVLIGASIDLLNDTNIIKYRERERQFNPNVAVLTPTLCEMLLKLKRKRSEEYKYVITSGQQIKSAVFRQFDVDFGPLINQYGSTEMGAIAGCKPTDSIDERMSSIGDPMNGVELHVDSDRFSDTEKPNIGELKCKHAYGFEGYVDDNHRWSERNKASVWYSTGDLAAIHDDGKIKILGRCDNSINRSGFLILLDDIESAIESLAQVAEACVIVSEGETIRGRKISAFCVLKSNENFNPKSLRDTCSQVLPKYAVPDNIFVYQSLPVLPSGKIDRKTLIKKAEEKDLAYNYNKEEE